MLITERFARRIDEPKEVTLAKLHVDLLKSCICLYDLFFCFAFGLLILNKTALVAK